MTPAGQRRNPVGKSPLEYGLSHSLASQNITMRAVEMTVPAESVASVERSITQLLVALPFVE
jgi:hypothetical protein